MNTNPITILYVEDDPFISESVAELLATANRRIVSVATIAGAQDALEKQNVNLLITDIRLPDGSGLEVAGAALRQNPRLPVIICSGEKEIAHALGSTVHVLKKPFDLDELEALVEKLAQ